MGGFGEVRRILSLVLGTLSLGGSGISYASNDLKNNGVKVSKKLKKKKNNVADGVRVGRDKALGIIKDAKKKNFKVEIKAIGPNKAKMVVHGKNGSVKTYVAVGAPVFILSALAVTLSVYLSKGKKEDKEGDKKVEKESTEKNAGKEDKKEDKKGDEKVEKESTEKNAGKEDKKEETEEDKKKGILKKIDEAIFDKGFLENRDGNLKFNEDFVKETNMPEILALMFGYMRRRDEMNRNINYVSDAKEGNYVERSGFLTNVLYGYADGGGYNELKEVIAKRVADNKVQGGKVGVSIDGFRFAYCPSKETIECLQGLNDGEFKILKASAAVNVLCYVTYVTIGGWSDSLDYGDKDEIAMPDVCKSFLDNEEARMSLCDEIDKFVPKAIDWLRKKGVIFGKSH